MKKIAFQYQQKGDSSGEIYLKTLGFRGNFGSGTACWEDGLWAEPPGPAERKLRQAYSPELVHSEDFQLTPWDSFALNSHKVYANIILVKVRETVHQ